jgi:hypothetical protein
MFTKQVSLPVDRRDPIVAAEAEQFERTRRKTWSRARSEFSVPFRRDAASPRTACVSPTGARPEEVDYDLKAIDRSRSEPVSATAGAAPREAKISRAVRNEAAASAARPNPIRDLPSPRRA